VSAMLHTHNNIRFGLMSEPLGTSKMCCCLIGTFNCYSLPRLDRERLPAGPPEYNHLMPRLYELLRGIRWLYSGMWFCCLSLAIVIKK